MAKRRPLAARSINAQLCPPRRPRQAPSISTRDRVHFQVPVEQVFQLAMPPFGRNAAERSARTLWVIALFSVHFSSSIYTYRNTTIISPGSLFRFAPIRKLDFPTPRAFTDNHLRIA